MYYLFVNHACLTLPAASGGHSWKVGGWAGCSSGCHWGPKVAPPDGQCGKDGCGHPWRSSGEKPVLSQADIHIGWTLNFLVKEKLSMHLFYIFPYEVCIIQKKLFWTKLSLCIMYTYKSCDSLVSILVSPRFLFTVHCYLEISSPGTPLFTQYMPLLFTAPYCLQTNFAIKAAFG